MSPLPGHVAAGFITVYARKRWISHLDRLLPERFARSLALRRPPLFHHLSFFEASEATELSRGALQATAKGHDAVADLQ